MLRHILLALALFQLGQAIDPVQLPVHAGEPAPRGTAGELLERLQRAVEAGDRRAAARMVQYPATVLASGWNIPIRDARTLLTMYEAVFTPEMRCAIGQSGLARTGAPSAKHAVIMSPEGVVLGSGAVWAPFRDGQYRIARMTLPPAVPSPTPRLRPERVGFPAGTGERTARFAGWLFRHNVHN